jgi:hypothetical protein
MVNYCLKQWNEHETRKRHADFVCGLGRIRRAGSRTDRVLADAMTTLRFKPCTFPNGEDVCGCDLVYLDAGTKTHAARLVCERCNRMRKWLSHHQYGIIKTLQYEIAVWPERAVLTDQHLAIGPKIVSFEVKENTGSIRKNETKKSDKSPDYWGDSNIEGTTYKVSAWVKEGKKGKYLSLAYTKKEAEAKEDLPF